jgi:hypothetical protein
MEGKIFPPHDCASLFLNYLKKRVPKNYDLIEMGEVENPHHLKYFER